MRVLLGISGSIAAYKGVILARALTQKGIEVTTVLTESALNFVTPLTLESLTQRRVYTNSDFFTPRETPIHLALARWSDLIVIAPTTAHLIAKIAHGFADDLLTSIVLTSNSPLILAPAMHSSMWENRTVVENVYTLRKRGIELLGPIRGELSTGETGWGRMMEPEDILSHIIKRLEVKRKLQGRKVLVAYGRTEEPIDPIRVITNRSSGKMGASLVDTAKKLGAHVISVEGLTSVPPSSSDLCVRVHTSDEMMDAIEKHIEDVDVFVMAAAVSDFKPAVEKGKKIKRGESFVLEFKPTVDILKEMSKRKKPHQIFVGFALESKDKLLEDARRKLEEKNLDIVVANELKAMGSDWTEGYILSKDGREESFSNITKGELSNLIFEIISEFGHDTQR
jgi:phosphopantothenoylcysteine decarboxylase/phosphopantothenate--cysteine ligase